MSLGRKKRFLLAVAGVTVVLLMMFLSNLGDTDVGPSYQGKSLSEWVIRIETRNWSHPDRTSPAFQQASNAIVQIGTNGIPHLLEWISYQPSRSFVTLLSEVGPLIDRLPLNKISSSATEPFGRWVRRDFDQADASLEALIFLGHTADLWVPELIVIATNYNNGFSARRAMEVLRWIGPASYPFLLETAFDTNSPLRHMAIRGVGRMGTNALPALPMLVDALDDPEPSIYSAAEYAIGRLGLEPDITIPSLIKVLEHSSRSGRIDVKYRLAYFGTNAEQVIPYLQLALTNQDHRVRTEISNVLEMIETETSKHNANE